MERLLVRAVSFRSPCFVKFVVTSGDVCLRSSTSCSSAEYTRGVWMSEELFGKHGTFV